MRFDYASILFSYFHAKNSGRAGRREKEGTGKRRKKGRKEEERRERSEIQGYPQL